MSSRCLPLFQCFELGAVLIADADEVFPAVVGHFLGAVEPVDVFPPVTSDQASFVLLRDRRLFGGELTSPGITGFALLMGVAFFKAQLRVGTDRFEVAAVPLAAMQIRRIGLAAADAWQISITRTDVGVECLLSLRLVVTVRPELCQSRFTALAACLLFGALALRFLLFGGFAGFCGLFFADRAGAFEAANYLPVAYRVEPLATSFMGALATR